MSEKPGRPRFLERASAPQSPDAVKRNRSNAMVVLGLVLFAVLGLAAAINPGGFSAGGLLLGIFGVGLIIGGLVIRP